MTLGQKIRNRRGELGLTQNELSEKSGVSQPYISLLGKDTFNPTAIYVIKLSKALDINVEELFETERNNAHNNKSKIEKHIFEIVKKLVTKNRFKSRNSEATPLSIGNGRPTLMMADLK